MNYLVHERVGAYDDTPIGQLSDSALEAFLRASGAEPSSITPAVIGALRADCQLYEDFTLDEATAKPLPCGGTVLLGVQDDVSRCHTPIRAFRSAVETTRSSTVASCHHWTRALACSISRHSGNRDALHPLHGTACTFPAASVCSRRRTASPRAPT